MPRLPKRANLYAPQGFGGETIGVSTTKRHTKKQVTKSQVTAAEALKNMVSVNTLGGVGKGFHSSIKRGGGTKHGEELNHIVCNFISNSHSGPVAPARTIGKLSDIHASDVFANQEPHALTDEHAIRLQQSAHVNMSQHSSQFPEANETTGVGNVLNLDDWIQSSTMTWNSRNNPLRKNMMEQVWNQGVCGCCFVFADLWCVLTCATIQSNYLAHLKQNPSWLREQQSSNLAYVFNSYVVKEKSLVPGKTACACEGGSIYHVLESIGEYGLLEDNEGERYGFPRNCFMQRECGCLRGKAVSAQQTCTPCGINKKCPSPFKIGTNKSYQVLNISQAEIENMAERVKNAANKNEAAYSELKSKWSSGEGSEVFRLNLTASTLKAIIVNSGPVIVLISANALESIGDKAPFQEASLNATALRPENAGPDHVVLVIGWVHNEGKEYWVVQNVWSIEWGYRGCAFLEIPSQDFDICKSFYEVVALNHNMFIDNEGEPILKNYNSPMTPNYWTNQPCGACLE